MKKFSIVLCFALFCAVVFSGNAFAADTVVTIPNYPTLVVTPSAYTLQYEYVVYKDTAGDTRLFVYFAAWDQVGEPFINLYSDEETSRLSFNVIKLGTYQNYILRNDIWEAVASGYNPANVGSSKLINSAVTEFIQTSEKITLADGTVVFPKPPVHNPTLAETIQAETTKAQETILKAMIVIALCGVGCLALLTVLPILSRVFSRYR